MAPGKLSMTSPACSWSTRLTSRGATASVAGALCCSFATVLSAPAGSSRNHDRREPADPAAAGDSVTTTDQALPEAIEAPSCFTVDGGIVPHAVAGLAGLNYGRAANTLDGRATAADRR